jgi:murein L,D-transpeptidase YcbB/YkuD
MMAMNGYRRRDAERARRARSSRAWLLATVGVPAIAFGAMALGVSAPGPVWAQDPATASAPAHGAPPSAAAPATAETTTTPSGAATTSPAAPATAAPATAETPAPAPVLTTADALRRLVEPRPRTTDEKAVDAKPPAPATADDNGLAAFYAARDFQPLWSTDMGPTAAARAALAALEQADRLGLFIEDYSVARLGAQAESRTPEGRAVFDALLSEGLLTYARDLAFGRLPRGAGLPPARVGAAELLPRLAGDGHVAALGALVPEDPRQTALIGALASLRDFAAKGGWPEIDDGPTLEPGQSDKRVEQVRRRLAVTEGEAKPDPAHPLRYNPALVEIVKRFQARHGLVPDGRIGKGSRQALNASVEHRIHQVIVALDRLRGEPKEAAPTRFVVNLPDYTLRVYDQGREVMSMAVVVGREQRPTPLMTTQITHVDFNPFWNVPVKLGKEDILPKLRADPQRLIDQGFRFYTSWSRDAEEVDPHTVDWTAVSQNSFGFRVRQDPGPANALGRIRLNMANPHDIYMHDTPDRHYFQRERRALSSGCIRVEKPIELTEFVMRQTPGNWSKEKIQNSIGSQNRTSVRLPQAIPVHLVYVTAWVGPDGLTNFREDIYGLDEDTFRALGKRRKTVMADRG